jgi:large subunit ribosomal protein L23
MALFGKKEKKEKEKENASIEVESSETKTSSQGVRVSKGHSYEVILHPRLTEKATGVVEDGNVYTFDVDTRATKSQISKAVKDLYKVSALKVRTSAVPKKDASVRGVNQGSKGGGKKAYVYLKKGDSIEFV